MIYMLKLHPFWFEIIVYSYVLDSKFWTIMVLVKIIIWDWFSWLNKEKCIFPVMAGVTWMTVWHSSSRRRWWVSPRMTVVSNPNGRLPKPSSPHGIFYFLHGRQRWRVSIPRGNCHGRDTPTVNLVLTDFDVWFNFS